MSNGSHRGSPLDGSVLVLNRFYMAIHVISVRRALVLLYRDLAEVIDVENGQYFNYSFESWMELSSLMAEQSPDDDVIHSVHFAIRVPRVMRLMNYDKVPRQTLRFNRRNLFARDDHTCQYCGNVFPLSQLSFDHVVPRSRGGATSWDNVVSCCLGCNGHKGDRLPAEAGMKLLKKPVRPKQNPLLRLKLDNPKYESWRSFISPANLALEVAGD
ncbi:MAG: HNH endonuclease [Planctomycetaceae bacterium]|nr:HNH endonuclease [Planctomycetaceae bacterium]